MKRKICFPVCGRGISLQFKFCFFLFGRHKQARPDLVAILKEEEKKKIHFNHFPKSSFHLQMSSLTVIYFQIDT